MCIYIVKKTKILKKFFKGGARLRRTSQIMRLRRKGYITKTNHVMLHTGRIWCVFFHW